MITLKIDRRELKSDHLNIKQFQQALDAVVGGGSCIWMPYEERLELQLPDDADVEAAESAVKNLRINANESESQLLAAKAQKQAEFEGDKIFDVLADLRRRVGLLEERIAGSPK